MIAVKNGISYLFWGAKKQILGGSIAPVTAWLHARGSTSTTDYVVCVVRLSERVNDAIMAVFCILLQDDRDDATVGRWQLFELLATFLTSMMTADVCDVR